MQSPWSTSLVLTFFFHLVAGLALCAGFGVLYLSSEQQFVLSAEIKLAILIGVPVLALLPTYLFASQFARKLAGLQGNSVRFLAEFDAEQAPPETVDAQFKRCLELARDRVAADTAEVERRAAELEAVRASAFVDSMRQSTENLMEACEKTCDRLDDASATAEAKSSAIEDSLGRTEALMADIPDQVEKTLESVKSGTDTALTSVNERVDVELDKMKVRQERGFLEIEAVAGQGLNNLQQNLEEMSAKAVKAVEDNAAVAQEGVDSLQKSLEAMQDSAATGIEDHLARANEAVEHLQSRFTELRDKISGDIAEQLARTGKDFAGFADSMQSEFKSLLEGSGGDLDALSQRFETEAARVELVAGQLESSAARVDDLTAQADKVDVQTLTQAIEALETAGQTFATLSKDAAQTNQHFTSLCDAKRAALEALEASANEQAGRLDGTVEACSSAVTDARSHVEGFVEEARKSVLMDRRRLDHAMDVVSEQLTARVEHLKEIDKGVQTSLGKLETSTDDFLGDLRDTLSGATEDAIGVLKTGTETSLDGLKLVVSEQSDGLKKHVTSIVDEQVKAASDLSRQGSDRLREILSRATSAMDHQLENLEAQMSTLSSRVDTGVIAVAGKLGDLFDQASEESARRFAESTKTLEEGQVQLSEQLGDLQSAGLSAMNFSNMLKAAEQSVTAKVELLESSRKQFDRIADTFESRLPVMLDKSMQSIEALAGDLNAQRTELKALFGQLEADGHRLGDVAGRLEPIDIDKYQVDMVDLKDKMSVVVRNIPMLGREVAAEVFAKLGGQISGFVADTSERMTGLEAVLQSARDSIAQSLEGGPDTAALDAQFARILDAFSTQAEGDGEAMRRLLQSQSELRSSLDQIVREMEGQTTQVSALDAKIGASLDAFSAGSSVADETNALSDGIAATADKIEDMRNVVLAEFSVQKDGLKHLNTALQPVSALSAAQTSVDTRLEAMQESLGALSGAVAAIESAGGADVGADSAGALEALQSAISAQIASLEARMARIKVEAPDLSLLSTVQAKVDYGFSDTESKLTALMDRLNALAAGAERGSDAPSLEGLQDGFEKLSALTSGLEGLKGELGALEASVLAQNEAVLSVPQAIDRLEGLEGLYRTRDLLTGHQTGLREGDIAFDRIATLFNKLEKEAEEVARTLIEGSGGAGQIDRQTLVRLLAHKDNIDSWSVQLRNISTALALGQDAAGVAAE